MAPEAEERHGSCCMVEIHLGDCRLKEREESHGGIMVEQKIMQTALFFTLLEDVPSQWTQSRRQTQHPSNE